MRDAFKFLAGSFAVYVCMASCSGGDSTGRSMQIASGGGVVGVGGAGIAGQGGAMTGAGGQGGAMGSGRDASPFDALLDALGDPVPMAERRQLTSVGPPCHIKQTVIPPRPRPT